MSDSPPKIGDTAPGLIWRKRKSEWVAVWLARTDLVNRGFLPRVVRLWNGVEPSDDDRKHISEECNRLQSEMLLWGRQGDVRPEQFDGTLEGLVEAYQTDKDSKFKKLRYATREYYTVLMRRIIKDHGDEDLVDIRARELLGWHEKWTDASGVAMAHALMGMLRTLFGFGATYLESDECERLCGIMHRMRFKMAKPRTVHLTAEHANAIRATAHETGRHSIAMAQAFQFDCTFRQKDVIGEWVPIDEPGVSDTTAHGKKWLRGIRWEEIDESLILKHTTSKRQKDIEIDLKLAPMALEELERKYGKLVVENPVTKAITVNRHLLPASGPIIISEYTGRPWFAQEFRRRWRRDADLAGIPKEIRNMDSRAGAISEARDAGADLESIRHAATHSNITTTQNYSRGAADIVAKVMKLRGDHRNRK